jgi:hypothetical protein
MKTSVELQRNPNPAFAKVAALIAKGPAPEWLVLGLEHFSGFLGLDPLTSDQVKRFQKIFGQMDYSAGYLIKWLPMFASSMPVMAGIQCPDDVAIALDVLPRIKKVLARAAKPSTRKGGQRPNMQRIICAKVVVGEWRLIHGKPEPRSVEVYDACNKYWQACGGEYRGEDIENWRRDVEEAADADDIYIRTILSALKDGRVSGT